MEALREIFVMLGMKTDEKSFEKSMLAVETIKKGAEVLVEAFKKAGEALFEAIEQTAEQGEQLENLAKKTGATTDVLQGLGFAAHAVGADMGSVTNAMRAISVEMAKAAAGSEDAQKQFAKLGIKVSGANGKLRPLEEILGDVAKRFETMPDGPEKLALASQLFSRGGQDMILVLQEMAFWQKDAEDAGAKMSKGMVGQAADLDKSFDRFGLTLKGLTNSIVEPLLVPLKGIVDEMSKWLRAHREIIGSAIVRVVKALGAALYFVYRVSVPVVETFLKFADTTLGTVVIIGGLVLALAALAAGFLGAAIAAAPLVAEMIVAGAPIMAIVLAVLALIAVFALLAEDIYGYFHGKNSLFGLFINSFKVLGGEISKVASTWFTTAIEFWMEQFSTFKDWLKNLFLGSGIPSGFAGYATPGSTFDSSGRLTSGGIAGQLGGMGGGPGSVAGGGAAILPTFNAKFDIHQSPGQDPVATGNAVREKMDDWYHEKITRAFESTVGQYSPAGGG